MKSDQAKPTTIDEYIAGCPADVQATLQKIRATIRKAAPKATEIINYGMPAFKQHGYPDHQDRQSARQGRRGTRGDESQQEIGPDDARARRYALHVAGLNAISARVGANQCCQAGRQTSAGMTGIVGFV